MKQYIITVIGATILSAMANILAPDKWRKYISVITGFIIISCIIAPISKLTDTDLFAGFDNYYDGITDYEAVERDFITQQLHSKIAADIEKRFKDEFHEDIKASIKLSVNDKGEIERISHIKISGSDGDAKKTLRLCEIYGIKRDEVEYE